MSWSAPSEDALIAHLHRAALDVEGWQDFVLALERQVGGAKASIHGMAGPLHRPFVSVPGSFDPAFAQSYLAHYHRINPFMPLSAAIPHGQARVSPMDLPDEALRRTEFYNDWLRPQDDLSMAVAVKSRPHGDRSLVLSLNIRRRDGDRLATRAQRLLDRLEPHLSHAFQVSEVISALALRRFGSGGVIVLGCDTTLLWADPGSAAQEARLFGLDLRGRIRFRDGRVQDWLSQVAATGSAMGDRIGMAATRDGWTIRAIRPPGDMAPSLILGAVPPFASRIVLVLSPPPGIASATILRTRFRLTGVETGIALAIAQGRSTAEMADAAQVSTHTIRNQVRAVLHKLDARSRADVARIVAGLP